MKTPSNEEIAEVTAVAAKVIKGVIREITPDLIKLIAASRPDVSVHAIGELLTVDPYPAIQPRDYRKEMWIAAYAGSIAASATDESTRTIAANASLMAESALDDFDATFPETK